MGERAVTALSTANFMAPMYFILAGPKPWQGAVLSIDRGGKQLPGTPDIQRLDVKKGVWHLLQTNDDSNKGAEDSRRIIEKRKLRMLSQSDVNEDLLIKQMT